MIASWMLDDSIDRGELQETETVAHITGHRLDLYNIQLKSFVNSMQMTDIIDELPRQLGHLRQLPPLRIWMQL